MQIIDFLKYLSLVISILLIIKSVINIFKNVNAFILVILGFAVFVFLDIVKSLFIGTDPRVLKESTLIISVIYSYLSFSFFLFGYHFSKLKSFSHSSNSKNSNDKNTINFKRLNLLLLIILIYSIFFLIYLREINSHYVQALSSIPKAFIIITFYIYLKTKKIRYLLFTIILTFFSFFESSRRIYIAVFFTALIILLEYINVKKIKIRKRLKFVLAISFIIFFLFLNYLRSEHDFGSGFKPGDKLANTISYIVTLRSIDTFYNTGFTFETVPERFDYMYGRSYVALLFGFVPRAVWENKPLSYASDLAFRQRTNFPISSIDDWYSVNQYSLSPGFVGEAYANFGFLGIIILSYLFGFSTKYFDSKNFNKRIFTNPAILPYISLYSIFLLLLRGDFYAATIFSIQIFVFMKIILWIITSKRKIIPTKAS